jgi:hypothetical protein
VSCAVYGWALLIGDAAIPANVLAWCTRLLGSSGQRRFCPNAGSCRQ